MKRIFVVMAVLAAATLIGAGIAMAGISNTKHNLSNSATPTRTFYSTATATGTSEICVFCHTPHNVRDAAALEQDSEQSPGSPSTAPRWPAPRQAQR